MAAGGFGPPTKGLWVPCSATELSCQQAEDHIAPIGLSIFDEAEPMFPATGVHYGWDIEIPGEIYCQAAER